MAESQDDRAGISILLVDDEVELRHATAELLELMDYKVFQANDGLEALDIYRAEGQNLDVVILDLTMPRMGGKETFLAIRAINPEAKIILSSGYSEQDVSQDLKGNGPIGFLQKPYRIKELKNSLKQILSI